MQCRLKGPVGMVLRFSLAKLCALMQLWSRQTVGLSLDKERVWVGGSDDSSGRTPELGRHGGRTGARGVVRQLHFSVAAQQPPRT